VFNGSLRSLRCSLRAAVFVESDETMCRRISSVLEAFRRLLLQIGGANIAGCQRQPKIDPLAAIEN
jgi:hypothetical protein